MRALILADEPLSDADADRIAGALVDDEGDRLDATTRAVLEVVQLRLRAGPDWPDERAAGIKWCLERVEEMMEGDPGGLPK